MFARLFNILGQMSLPVTGRPSRISVAWTYLIVSIKALILRRCHSHRVRLFGKYVFPWNYERFRGQFIEIFVRREYEFSAEREDPFIIDCGGNIGLATLFFLLQYPKSRVITLEPSPTSFQCLKRMKDCNALERVDLHNVAAARTDGEISLYLEHDNPTSGRASIIAERGGSVALPVRAARLLKIYR